ncbi:MAG TPA: hypothetical protein PLH19_00535 [Anaerolineae bacterium]|nr:hypothetical protein [Anaerolineae bacterium]HQH37005.1 hypothetical protein [Anaerolineae bacterium]
MSVHLYLSMIPEALIASMLTPEEFGVYYAVGSEKKSHGQAIFFEIDPTFRHPELPVDEGIHRCVPHEDGRPKNSIYITVYRALERVPLEAIWQLYLVTQDGRVLGLDGTNVNIPEDTGGLHLYQEVAPVHPLIVSTLGAQAFYDLIVKNPTSLLTLPAVCFAELRLGELAHNPEFGSVGDLPYPNIDHLRQCLTELSTKKVHTKMVDRLSPAAFPYRMLKSGVFVGNTEKLLFFSLPSQEELRAQHYRWWRSANM